MDQKIFGFSLLPVSNFFGSSPQPWHTLGYGWTRFLVDLYSQASGSNGRLRDQLQHQGLGGDHSLVITRKLVENQLDLDDVSIEVLKKNKRRIRNLTGLNCPNFPRLQNLVESGATNILIKNLPYWENFSTEDGLRLSSQLDREEGKGDLEDGMNRA